MVPRELIHEELLNEPLHVWILAGTKGMAGRLSLLLIKSGLCPGCLRPQGHGQGYMIPFWICLHMRMVCKLVLSVWAQFDDS